MESINHSVYLCAQYRDEDYFLMKITCLVSYIVLYYLLLYNYLFIKIKNKKILFFTACPCTFCLCIVRHSTARTWTVRPSTVRPLIIGFFRSLTGSSVNFRKPLFR